jgi:hypothetical protein
VVPVASGPLARYATGYGSWLAAEDPLERLLDDNRRYLFDERGVTEHTVFGRYEPTPVVAGMHRGVSSWYDRSYAVATASATNAAIAAVNSRLLSSQA